MTRIRQRRERHFIDETGRLFWINGPENHCYFSEQRQWRRGLSFDEDGTALHVGARIGNGTAGALVEIGGVKTDSTDGLEARAGLSWEPANWGLFTEYRHTELKPDGSNNNVRIAVWRGGVRWNF